MFEWLQYIVASSKKKILLNNLINEWNEMSPYSEMMMMRTLFDVKSWKSEFSIA